MDITTYALCKKMAESAVSGVSSMTVEETTLKINTNNGETLEINFPTPNYKVLTGTIKPSEEKDGYVMPSTTLSYGTFGHRIEFNEIPSNSAVTITVHEENVGQGNGSGYGIVLVDDNENVLEMITFRGATAGTWTHTFPIQNKRTRLLCSNNMTGMMVTNVEYTQYVHIVEYDEIKEYFSEKHLVCDGDSLTWENANHNSWVHHTNSILHFNEVTNIALGNATLRDRSSNTSGTVYNPQWAVDSDEWVDYFGLSDPKYTISESIYVSGTAEFDQATANNCLYGHLGYLINKVQAGEINEPDVFILAMGGINDLWGANTIDEANRRIGTFEEAILNNWEEINRNTILNSVRWGIQCVRKHFPECKLFFKTSAQPNHTSHKYYYLLEEPLIKLLKYLSVPVIDTYGECGINGEFEFLESDKQSSNLWTLDGVHPTEKGHKKDGEFVACKILSNTLSARIAVLSSQDAVDEYSVNMYGDVYTSPLEARNSTDHKILDLLTDAISITDSDPSGTYKNPYAANYLYSITNMISKGTILSHMTLSMDITDVHNGVDLYYVDDATHTVLAKWNICRDITSGKFESQNTFHLNYEAPADGRLYTYHLPETSIPIRYNTSKPSEDGVNTYIEVYASGKLLSSPNVGDVISPVVSNGNFVYNNVSVKGVNIKQIDNKVEKFYNDQTVLSPKTISILGDSISTFKDYIPDGNVGWYKGDNCGVTSVDQTWWMRVINKLGLELNTNNSWAGSRVTTTSTAGASGVERSTSLDNGTDPDIIIVYMGHNDRVDSAVKMGTYNGRGVVPTETTTFREAYAVMLDNILNRYPSSKVYACTITPSEKNGAEIGSPEHNSAGVYIQDINTAIREIADALCVEVIDLASCGITYRNANLTMGDYNTSNNQFIHPNAEGHRLIACKVIKSLKDSFGV